MGIRMRPEVKGTILLSKGATSRQIEGFEDAGWSVHQLASSDGFFRGVYDIRRECPDDAEELLAMGVDLAVGVMHSIWYMGWEHGKPTFTTYYDYSWDEPDIHGPNRLGSKLPPGSPVEFTMEMRTVTRSTYTTIWGGFWGFGIWKWRKVADAIGTDILVDTPGLKRMIQSYVKLFIAAFAFRKRTWFLTVNSYTPCNTDGGRAKISSMPKWWIPHWEWWARALGASGIFLLGWDEHKDAIRAAWGTTESEKKRKAHNTTTTEG